MSSTRTPTGGTISMSDLDKSITNAWSSPTSNQNLSDYNTQDFNTGSAPNGFAYCYGNTGVGTPIRLTDYFDILGYVDYEVRANNLTTVSGMVTVDFNPMNGSNGAPPNQLQISVANGQLPTGVARDFGAHWETLQFQVTVAGMGGGSFDVYFDGSYIDTIIMDGIYVYDNGGLGYTNGYGAGAGNNIVQVNLT